MPRTETLRRHGHPPYGVAVLHGGPGAPGSAAGLARALGSRRGVLEPQQTRTGIDDLVAELREVLTAHAAGPVALVGHSWGAWLALYTAAAHPGLVRALVLVGCAPLRAADADGILPARLARLAPSERAEVAALRARLPAAPPAERDALLARWGALLARADAYDPLPGEEDHAGCDYAQHQAVWEEARARREAGDLLAAAGRVRCPVTVLHGAHDPHPAAPLRRDLAGAGVRLTFHLLARCGHEPWRERQARERFLALLEAAVA